MTDGPAGAEPADPTPTQPPAPAHRPTTPEELWQQSRLRILTEWMYGQACHFLMEKFGKIKYEQAKQAADVVGACWWTWEIVQPGQDWPHYCLLIGYAREKGEFLEITANHLMQFPPTPDRDLALQIVRAFGQGMHLGQSFLIGQLVMRWMIGKVPRGPAKR